MWKYSLCRIVFSVSPHLCTVLQYGLFFFIGISNFLWFTVFDGMLFLSFFALFPLSTSVLCYSSTMTLNVSNFCFDSFVLPVFGDIFSIFFTFFLHQFFCYFFMFISHDGRHDNNQYFISFHGTVSLNFTFKLFSFTFISEHSVRGCCVLSLSIFLFEIDIKLNRWILLLHTYICVDLHA